jgi:ankyrin repeat protein
VTPDPRAAAEEQRCAEHRRRQRVDAAFSAGDMEALLAELDGDETPDFPNGYGPWGMRCSVLQNAIYHSPLPFIRQLLELGADPNYDDGDGFPSLIAALSSRPAPALKLAGRQDVHELMALLLSYGANPNQHGLNDYTPLHWAASEGDVRAVTLLLAHGADPAERTRIDDYETPLEVAERAGRAEVAQLLREASR